MAKQHVRTTAYTDDIDGSNAANTVSFAFAGISYEIDLSRSNTRAFQKALRPYLNASRTVRPAPTAAASTRARAAGKHDLSQIRAWAKSNGYPVSDRGRIARTLVEAYEAAQ